MTTKENAMFNELSAFLLNINLKVNEYEQTVQDQELKTFICDFKHLLTGHCNTLLKEVKHV